MGSDAGAAGDVEPGSGRASLWEDFVDIFYAPSQVFARRADGKFGMPLLFLVVVCAVLAFLTKNAMQPVMDAEFARRSAEMMRKNPNLTAEQMASGRGFFEPFGPRGDQDRDVRGNAAHRADPGECGSGTLHGSGEADFHVFRWHQSGAIHGSGSRISGDTRARESRRPVRHLDHGASGDRAARGREDSQAAGIYRGGDCLGCGCVAGGIRCVERGLIRIVETSTCSSLWANGWRMINEVVSGKARITRD